MGGAFIFLPLGISWCQTNHPSLKSYRANLARSTTDSARAYWAINLGEAFLNYQNDSAIHYFQRSIQLAEASKSRILQRLAYLKLGREYLFYTDFLSTIDMLNKAETLGRSMPVDSIQLEIQIMKARAYRSSGQYDTGLRLCLELLNKYQYKQHHWPQQLALLHAELGIIHLHLHHFDESKQYFLEQLALSRMSRNKRSILIAFGNLGTLYGENNRFEEAEACFRQSYELAMQINPPILLGYVYLNFGELAMHRKRYKAAIAYIKRSLHYTDNYTIDRGYAYLMLATCYQENQQYLEALQQINQAIRIYHSTASLQPEQEALSLKAKLLSQLGLFKAAFAISERAHQFGDSLFGLNKEKSIAQI
jgi:tetratricopeptide (TPR) repeat protein